MNGTPMRRGPGGFSSTPQTSRTPPFDDGTTRTPRRPNVREQLPRVPRLSDVSDAGPLIPTHILDPAQQRFYAVAFYAGLWAWKLYDWYNLNQEETESMWQFLKWLGIDMVFVFMLPLFKIPWLEYGNVTATLVYILHAAVNGMLMFRVGIPFQAWALNLIALMWDSELAISERSVKPGAIIHNASLILGKQIINILPEGSAILNPSMQPYCLNSTVTHLDIPIIINQTEPTSIELLRIDLGTNEKEAIKLHGRELKQMMKKARKAQKVPDPASPLELHYTVKRTGIYMLRRIIDESKLEVRPRTSSAIVATCPKARVRPTGEDRCRNDLSNIAIEVDGIPPLRLKYRTSIGGRPREATELQGLIPDGFNSPLSRHTAQALVRTQREDVTWAQSQEVTVPLNEMLGDGGVWTYAVEEVTDGIGNHVSYFGLDEDDRPRHKSSALHSFTVHERPNVVLTDCSAHQPLQVAKGQVTRLPVQYGSTGKKPIDLPHTIDYLFTPEADLTLDGSHSPDAKLETRPMVAPREQPVISAAGLYTIKSVSTQFCQGEVLEPASCLLRNPPEPELSISHDDIFDKCAGQPIGLRVSLDLIGTPPFRVKYRSVKNGRKTARPEEIKVDTLRHTLELTPDEAGHYEYNFISISDWVYKNDRPLNNLQLVQDVKPSASAHFIGASLAKQVCIDDVAEFDVGLRGEAPFTLDYELVHNGKRQKRSVAVEGDHYTIKTDKLKNGGEYILSLASVMDKNGCKESLKSEAKINVRHERPKAYFGTIDGKTEVMALEGKSVDLPVRLTGQGPWKLEYENLDTKEVIRPEIRQANHKLHIRTEGIYQLVSVRDAVCPGFIDEKANQFSVGWIPRPKIHVPEKSYKSFDHGKYIREPVCEGDEDSFDVALSGNAPYELAYEQQFKDQKGKNAALKKKELRSVGGSASIRAETDQAGTYQYKFTQLADAKYDHSPRHFFPVTVVQTVHPRPNARFNSPGKTYSYCSREEDGEEVIPITLEGVPPFYLEVEIKHYGTLRPEISVHKNIPTNKYDLKIEHRKLALGHSTISFRKIRDARGCTQKPAPGGPRVQISVHDAPTATPMDDRTDFCVGERLAFALSGQVPFTVYYTFEGKERKASNAGTTFKRLAELPGTFTLTGLRDSASECLASLSLTKTIHPIPSVRLSGGQVSHVDIHEGGGTDLEFQFWGTPPFEFTYTRSTNEAKGRKSRVLEIRTEISHEYFLSIPVQEEGTYEVVSIKDRWCSFSRPVEGVDAGKGGVGGGKLLTY